MPASMIACIPDLLPTSMCLLLLTHSPQSGCLSPSISVATSATMPLYTSLPQPASGPALL
jgi:hypothetical protein